MTNNYTNFRGLARLIYDSLNKINPGFVLNGQIYDNRLLQELENDLRRQLVIREDGSKRLVIDLALTRAMREVRDQLKSEGRLPVGITCVPGNIFNQALIRG